MKKKVTKDEEKELPIEHGLLIKPNKILPLPKLVFGDRLQIETSKHFADTKQVCDRKNRAKVMALMQGEFNKYRADVITLLKEGEARK